VAYLTLKMKALFFETPGTTSHHDTSHPKKKAVNNTSGGDEKYKYRRMK